MTSDLLCCQVHPYSLYGLGLQFRWQVCSTVVPGKKGENLHVIPLPFVPQSSTVEKRVRN